MKIHRQGRTGATFVVPREAPARRLLATLRGICQRLRRALPDPDTRRAYLAVERELAELERRWGKNRTGRKPGRT